MSKKKSRPSPHTIKDTKLAPLYEITEKFQTALAMHQQGQLDLAEPLYREILNERPTHFDSLLFLGHLSLQTGRTQNAIEFLGKAIEINPNHASAHFDYGVALLNVLQYQNAAISFSHAIKLKPDYSEAFNNQGSAWQNLGEHEKAIACFDRSIELTPDNEFAYNNKGISLQKLERHAEAITSFDRAILLNISNGVTHNNRGISLLNIWQFEDALASFDRAIDLIPDYTDAFINRGIVLPGLGRLEDALVSFDRAIELRPGSALAHNNRGMALLGLRRYEDAIVSFDKAIELLPNYFEAFNNRALALPYIGRHEEALASLELAIDPKNDSFDARNNRGNILRDLKRHEEALESYRKALEIRPDDATANYNESMCRLQMGDFEQGWAKLEWRWKTSQFKNAKREFIEPLWLGKEPLRDKTILLHAEQGLGDTIQFCRYAKLAAEQGATVILEVQPEVKSLLTSLKGINEILAKGEALPPFDYHCPLLSLPLAFNTLLSTIPAETGYLRSDPSHINIWQSKLGDKTLPRIGLAWSGNKLFGNDHNRSIPLTNLTKLMSPGIVQFVSLQKEVRESDQITLDAHRDVAHFGNDLHDFSDTAALIDLMDVVISVDTSVAHLAGALGKPVWLLLPFNPDWRWLLDRSDTPWYPSAKLFRQTRNGDWEGVIKNITQEISAIFS